MLKAASGEVWMKFVCSFAFSFCLSIFFKKYLFATGFWGGLILFCFGFGFVCLFFVSFCFVLCVGSVGLCVFYFYFYFLLLLMLLKVFFFSSLNAPLSNGAPL